MMLAILSADAKYFSESGLDGSDGVS